MNVLIAACLAITEWCILDTSDLANVRLMGTYDCGKCCAEAMHQLTSDNPSRVYMAFFVAALHQGDTMYAADNQTEPEASLN